MDGRELNADLMKIYPLLPYQTTQRTMPKQPILSPISLNSFKFVTLQINISICQKMEPEFKIIEVLNSRGGTDEHSLIFKINWTESNQIAYMQFDMAKKKYPLIVLDYLASRIKQKPATQSSPNSKPSQQLKTNIISPVTNHTDSPIIYKKQEPQTRLQKFFQNCSFCQSQKTCSQMLDYDAIIPIDNNIAYPVFLKLGAVGDNDGDRRKTGRERRDIRDMREIGEICEV